MDHSIYSDIARRTGGNIYLGIVGPVRSGKSTFITRLMNTLVIPNIADDFQRERANDELPQSSAGKTIMTTEPKFVPEKAVTIVLDGGVKMNVRLIDCVGYIVPSAIGYIENEAPRMVMTPWFEEEIPFNMAAEVGTRKVITAFHHRYSRHHRRKHYRYPPRGVPAGGGTDSLRTEGDQQAVRCDTQLPEAGFPGKPRACRLHAGEILRAGDGGKLP